MMKGQHPRKIGREREGLLRRLSLSVQMENSNAPIVGHISGLVANCLSWRRMRRQAAI
jgi:hypothetical protein